MKISLTICGCFALLMLGLFFWRGAVLENKLAATAKALPMAADAAIAREGALTRAMLDARLAALQASADGHLNKIEGLMSARLDAVLERADSKLDRALTILDQRSGQVAADFDSAAISLAEVAKLRSDLQPTVTQINLLSGPLFRNALGATAAAKITLGDLAQAGRSFNATSKALEQAALNSQEASKQTATTMKHLAVATQPLPKWLRVGLAIAPPAAQTAAAVVLSIVK